MRRISRTINTLLASTLLLGVAGCAKEEPVDPLEGYPFDITSPEESFAYAKKIYEEFYALDMKYQSSGGAATLPGEFNQYLMDEALDDQAELLASQYQKGYIYSGEVSWDIDVIVQYTGSDLPEGNQYALETCAHSGGAVVTIPDGSVTHDGTPRNFHSYALFRFDEEKNLKIWQIREERVESCPITEE
jgi:hypothetical protein